MGAMQLAGKEQPGLPVILEAGKRRGRILSWSLKRKHGFADILISDSQTPELRENSSERASFGCVKQVCGPCYSSPSKPRSLKSPRRITRERHQWVN